VRSISCPVQGTSAGIFTGRALRDALAQACSLSWTLCRRGSDLRDVSRKPGGAMAATGAGASAGSARNREPEVGTLVIEVIATGHARRTTPHPGTNAAGRQRSCWQLDPQRGPDELRRATDMGAVASASVAIDMGDRK
jgi:hypothetical protein